MAQRLPSGGASRRIRAYWSGSTSWYSSIEIQRKRSPVELGEVRPLPQQRQRPQEQVVEVEQAPALQGLLVERRSAAASSGERLRVYRAAADASDLLQKPLGLGRSEVEELARDLHPLRRGRHPEAAGEPRRLRLLAQQREPQAVEGGDEARAPPPGQQRRQPLLHLRRRPPAEGDGQALLRRRPALGDQVGEPVRQRPGLPRSRPGDDEERAVHDLRRRRAARGRGRSPHSPGPPLPASLPPAGREGGLDETAP